MDELVSAGQARGVPIAAVLSPAETLGSEHFRSVGALTDATIAPGAEVTMPIGAFVVDGRHLGFARPAPSAGADEAAWRTTRSDPAGAAGRQRARTGRSTVCGFSISASSSPAASSAGCSPTSAPRSSRSRAPTYPDGLRQTPPGQMMSRSWALTHRNEYGLGLDLRSAEGAAIFSRLVAGADAVFANFKPGTLASLGFSVREVARAQSPHRVGRKQCVRRDGTVERPDGLRASGTGHHRRHQAVDLR